MLCDFTLRGEASGEQIEACAAVHRALELVDLAFDLGVAPSSPQSRTDCSAILFEPGGEGFQGADTAGLRVDEPCVEDEEGVAGSGVNAADKINEAAHEPDESGGIAILTKLLDRGGFFDRSRLRRFDNQPRKLLRWSSAVVMACTAVTNQANGAAA